MSIERLRAIHAEMGTIIASMGGGGTVATNGSGPIADDRELDSQYGNPEVRFDPKRWTGASYKGRKYSECPSDFLETLASFLDWSAGKDEASGDPELVKKAGYRRRDSSRARGWARRNAGKTPAPARGSGLDGIPDTGDDEPPPTFTGETGAGGDDGDGIPF